VTTEVICGENIWVRNLRTVETWARMSNYQTNVCTHVYSMFQIRTL